MAHYLTDVEFSRSDHKSAHMVLSDHHLHEVSQCVKSIKKESQKSKSRSLFPRCLLDSFFIWKPQQDVDLQEGAFSFHSDFWLISGLQVQRRLPLVIPQNTDL